ncbi:hypothetical protein E4U17_000518 [Claviceps sp. LM77 group G4]|nr:hypothetical protein E4U17_000518 [Claviceps sp. LM77 group G4]KAG6076284.1 hypothetical protein E4U33_001868 [Claviceps sp. LM78 group G4]
MLLQRREIHRGCGLDYIPNYGLVTADLHQVVIRNVETLTDMAMKVKVTYEIIDVAYLLIERGDTF